MRKIIAALQVSLDGFIEGADGELDWVDSWEDTFDIIGKVGGFILGARMYPGYEQDLASGAGQSEEHPAVHWQGRDRRGDRVCRVRRQDAARCRVAHAAERVVEALENRSRSPTGCAD